MVCAPQKISDLTFLIAHLFLMNWFYLVAVAFGFVSGTAHAQSSSVSPAEINIACGSTIERSVAATSGGHGKSDKNGTGNPKSAKTPSFLPSASAQSTLLGRSANAKPVWRAERAFLKVKDGGVTLSSGPAVAGALLASGDVISTSDGTAIVELSDGSTLRVWPNTTITLEKLLKNRASKITRRDIVVQGGRVEASVVPGSAAGRTDTRVRTNRVVVMVKGTEFRVASSDDQNTTTEVESGLVSLRPLNGTCGAPILLGAGSFAVANTDEIRVREMPAPPLQPEGGILNDASFPLTLPVAYGVSAYSFQITGGEDLQVFRTQIVPAGQPWARPVLPPGRYAVQVRSLTAEGVQGKSLKLPLELAQRLVITWSAGSDGSVQPMEIRLHDESGVVIRTDVISAGQSWSLPELSPGFYEVEIRRMTDGGVQAKGLMLPVAVGKNLKAFKALKLRSISP